MLCYCDGCLDGFECAYVDYVDVWEEVDLQHKFQPERRSSRAGEQLQREQIKDLVTRDSTLAIAAADCGEDYYLLIVVSDGSEVLNRPTTGGYGASHPAGAEIFWDIFTFVKQKMR